MSVIVFLLQSCLSIKIKDLQNNSKSLCLLQELSGCMKSSFLLDYCPSPKIWLEWHFVFVSLVMFWSFIRSYLETLSAVPPTRRAALLLPSWTTVFTRWSCYKKFCSVWSLKLEILCLQLHVHAKVTFQREVILFSILDDYYLEDLTFKTSSSQSCLEGNTGLSLYKLPWLVFKFI